ncbi:MAG: hypothetical protein ABIJ34_07255 [archaeon]
MKKRRHDKVSKSYLHNTRFKINLSLIILFAFFLLFKRWFFVAFFIILNFIVLNFKSWTGIKLPLEIISLGTTMCGYVYGPKEAIIVVSSSWISIAMSTRVGLRIIFSQLLLTVMALFVHYFSKYSIVFVGIVFLIIRYTVQFLFEFLFVGTGKALEQIPRRILNFIFWIIFYNGFGAALAQLMIP